VQGRFWDMNELLFHRQKALDDGDLLGYAAQLGLDVAAFDRDRASTAVAERIRRDVDSGLASGQVLGAPTLFIDGIVHRGGYDPPALLAATCSTVAAGSRDPAGRMHSGSADGSTSATPRTARTASGWPASTHSNG
jgi:predicted DsbA family dithiol-disulfide isomerase